MEKEKWKMKGGKWKEKGFLLVWLAALAAMGGALLWFEIDQLWKVQELNLFLDTPLFFREQMVVAGGMLTYVSTFFTQYLYHPWLGVLLLCSWWLLLMALLKKAFGVPPRWASLLLIPVALLLLTDMDLGYWVYVLKLRGHFFLTTIATTCVAALLWGFRSLKGKWWMQAAWLVLTCAVGYPLLGIYGLAATLLMGIWSWRQMAPGKSAVCTFLAIVCVVIVPLFCYRYVYHEMNLANSWYAGLPLFFITEEYPHYYIPYYLLALFFLVMTLLPPFKASSPLTEGTVKTIKPENRKNEKAKAAKKPAFNLKPYQPAIVQAVLLAATAWGLVHYWYRDENFDRELKMQRMVEQLDWNGIVEEAAKQVDEPTRAIVMMRNIALWRLGRQGEDMCRYMNGSKKSNAPFDMRPLLSVGTLIYYQYGLLNDCNRLCTEMGVEYNWRPEFYKYMVRCALLNGEDKAARKYINILKHTRFFASWAAHAEQLLGNRELIAKDPEMEPITHMLHYPSSLTSDQGFVERFTMRQLANSSYPEDPVYQEQSLLASLWMKDPKLFWYHFGIYIQLHPGNDMPLVYQEAAYLYGKLENRPNLDRLPFSQHVKDSFDRFMHASASYDGMDIKEARKILYPLFGNTFYYDYYLMSNLPEY